MQAPQRGRGRWAAAICTAVFATAGLQAIAATSASAARYHGSAARVALKAPIVGIGATPSGQGYWLVASDGGIFSFGDAHFYGSTGALRLAKPIVGMTSTASGHGYWLVAGDGGIFTFGDAHFYGSTGAMRLAKPIVGMARTRSGHGYWLVASDGGIFTFGDAHFYGSTGAMRLAEPIVGMARTPSGHGYWLVASDGGIFTFGDAHYHGSTGGRVLAQPIIGMSRTASGRGYWLVARDGGVFAFGSAHFFGSATGAMAGQPTIGIAASPKSSGYWIASQWGAVASASSAGMRRDPSLAPPPGVNSIANELMHRINVERAARGLHQLTINSALQADAQAWAARLASTGPQLVHQDLGRLINKTGLQQAGENLYGGRGSAAVSAGVAHFSLMDSAMHRSNILLPEDRVMGVGAACMNGWLIVVEDFGTPFGVPMQSHPTPPLNPVAASIPGGAGC